MSGHRLRQMRRRTFAVEVDHPHFLELSRARDQRVEQHGRRGRAAVEEDLLPGADPGDGFGSGDDAHDEMLLRHGVVRDVPVPQR